MKAEQYLKKKWYLLAMMGKAQAHGKKKHPKKILETYFISMQNKTVSTSLKFQVRNHHFNISDICVSRTCP